MISLYDALDAGVNPNNALSIKKRLREVGIKQWADLDKWHLTRFATEVKKSMAASSAHTTFAVFKAFLGKFEDEITLPKDWRKLLEQKNELPMNTYLTKEEVEAFGEAFVESDEERTVRDGFYVSCKTGLRHSDLIKLNISNFTPRGHNSYTLSYVSKKTRIKSDIPCSMGTMQKIAWLHQNGKEVSLTYYNAKVRELAQRAGIDTEVAVYRAGKEMSGPKYKFISSHSARRSFCTILADLGTDLLDIMRLSGHTNPAMTGRYVVRHDIKVNPEVEKFLT